jgi:peptide/nickel transport system substrate-binding protein
MVVGLSAVAAEGATSPAATSHYSGSITFAEAPTAPPNYIFPYSSCSYFSVTNLDQFQYLMYRPLFWFGLGSSVDYQPSLSLASEKFAANDRSVTITMKGWKFSNGTVINAESVRFFLNMLKAVPQDYCGYNAGIGIPDQVSSVQYSNAGAGKVILNFKVAVSPAWMLYNYLSFITPMPNTWDVSGAHTARTCATDVYGSAKALADCTAVYNYLNTQSLNNGTWTSSLWQAADSGPWKLSAQDGVGDVTFVPNTKYSGPVKAHLASVHEKAYAMESSEVNDLVSDKIQLGYVDPTDVPGPATTPGGTGPNVSSLSSHYVLTGGIGWQFNYNELNWNVAGGNLLKQQYIREALQYGIPQAAMAKSSSVYKNYATITCSPLPSNLIDPANLVTPPACAYGYSQSAAKSLLAAHGWGASSGGDVCNRPGTSASECGAGISGGDHLSLSFEFLSNAAGAASNQSDLDEIASWNAIGINIVANPTGFDTGIGDCTNYDMCNWGGGWSFAPDYLPTGETLFQPGGGFNLGAVNLPALTALIKCTDFGCKGESAKTALTKYADLAASDLPVNYVPTPTGIGERSRTLVFLNKTSAEPSPLGLFMPEYITHA